MALLMIELDQESSRGMGIGSMSEQGRRKNRERRALAATPGAEWTATRAAERIIECRDEIVDKYSPGARSPLLTVFAARHRQIAIADLLIYPGHQEREVHDRS
jgi:hypothetical protein